MKSDSKIFVAGSNGMVGSAIVRNLKEKGYTNIITKSRKELDLTQRSYVENFFQDYQPEYVIFAAAKVGGIMANKTYPADFIRDNLAIQLNVIDCAQIYGVKKFLFLGSSCIYPRLASQPISEDQLMTGPLEPTNECYSLAKIAGIKMCQAYKEQYGFNAISIMPSNLYGPNDCFDPEKGHVLASLIRKIHEAKINNLSSIDCWGDGSAMREFLYVEDLAEACHFCMLNYDSPEILNVGTGKDLTIKNLVEKISKVVEYNGKVNWDISKPNGIPRKVLNIDKIKSLGWEPKIGLYEGIHRTYTWYKENEI